MKKILFLIHDLGQGGAEKVLVNLVNNMDQTKFEITVMTLFDVGVNRQFLKNTIIYKSCFSKVFPANSHIMKLWSPEKLHGYFIKEEYDIEVSYLEGPCARIISGCQNANTKLVSWIHSDQSTIKRASMSFRNFKEARKCYSKFDRIVCVSEALKNGFQRVFGIDVLIDVLYNTNETKQILEKATENIEEQFTDDKIYLVGVGKLQKNKGFDRLLRIGKKLLEEKYPIRILILGIGPEEENLKAYIKENNMLESVKLLGYQINPYKYVAKSDIFICSSWSEGFSTAATEALIVGTPVCTMEVAGMKEMLGEHNEYGLIVENDEACLYQGIKQLLDNPDVLNSYKEKAKERGKIFSAENTVNAVEEMLMEL